MAQAGSNDEKKLGVEKFRWTVPLICLWFQVFRRQTVDRRQDCPALWVPLRRLQGPPTQRTAARQDPRIHPRRCYSRPGDSDREIEIEDFLKVDDWLIRALNRMLNNDDIVRTLANRSTTTSRHLRKAKLLKIIGKICLNNLNFVAVLLFKTFFSSNAATTEQFMAKATSLPWI